MLDSVLMKFWQRSHKNKVKKDNNNKGTSLGGFP